MSQFTALLYKNYKLATRQWVTSLFQLLSPIFCIVCVLVLQFLAKQQSEKQNIKPPFEIPFGGLYPINIPLDLFKVKEFGVNSCMRMNKYAFSKSSDQNSIKFIDEFLGFQKSSGIRNGICQRPGMRPFPSPHFNKTSFSTSDQINDDLLQDMERFYGTNIKKIFVSEIPVDGYYLFNNASQSEVSATLFSNNMNIQFYHRANSQTGVVWQVVWGVVWPWSPS